jgi:hypothetical protein
VNQQPEDPVTTTMAGSTAILSRYQEAQTIANKDKQKGIEMFNQIGECYTLFPEFLCSFASKYTSVYSNEGLSNGNNVSAVQTKAVEEMIRVKEQAILDLGSLLSRSGRGQELANLISGVRPFLSLVSKAKAAKLVRQLVDLLLDMDPPESAAAADQQQSIGMDVKENLVRDCIAWAEQVCLSCLLGVVLQSCSNICSFLVHDCHVSIHNKMFTGEADFPEAVTGSPAGFPAV